MIRCIISKRSCWLKKVFWAVKSASARDRKKESRVDMALDVRRRMRSSRRKTPPTPMRFVHIGLHKRAENTWKKITEIAGLIMTSSLVLNRQKTLTHGWRWSTPFVQCLRMLWITAVTTRRTGIRNIAETSPKSFQRLGRDCKLRYSNKFLTSLTLLQSCPSWRRLSRPLTQTEFRKARLCDWSTTSWRNCQMMVFPSGCSGNRRHR